MGRRSVTNPAPASAAAVACALAVAAAVVVSSCASAALASAPASASSSILFFSDAPGLFRQRQNVEAAAASALSTDALAHVVEALVGRPLPAGETEAAQQVDALLSPNVFSRARWLLTVVVSGVPSSDAAGEALSSKTFKLTDSVSLSLVQQRAVATSGAAVDDDDDRTAAAEALLRELSAVSAGPCTVSQQGKEALQRCLSSEAGDAEACAGVVAQLEEGVECVQGSMSTTAYPRPGQPASLSLLHVPLQQQQADPAAASSERLQGAVEAVVARAASLARAAASGAADLPLDARMVVAVVLVSGTVDEARLRQAVEADAGRTRGAHARALMAEEEGDGEAKVASDTEAAAATSTPEDVALNTVLFGAVFFLLAAFALGVVALFTMPITRDTLLYSGAKMD